MSALRPGVNKTRYERYMKSRPPPPVEPEEEWMKKAEQPDPSDVPPMEALIGTGQLDHEYNPHGAPALIPGPPAEMGDTDYNDPEKGFGVEYGVLKSVRGLDLSEGWELIDAEWPGVDWLKEVGEETAAENLPCWIKSFKVERAQWNPRSRRDSGGPGYPPTFRVLDPKTFVTGQVKINRTKEDNGRGAWYVHDPVWFPIPELQEPDRLYKEPDVPEWWFNRDKATQWYNYATSRAYQETNAKWRPPPKNSFWFPMFQIVEREWRAYDARGVLRNTLLSEVSRDDQKAWLAVHDAICRNADNDGVAAVGELAAARPHLINCVRTQTPNWSLLHKAAARDCPATVEALLGAGADPSVIDDTGLTPYEVAKDGNPPLGGYAKVPVHAPSTRAIKALRKAHRAAKRKRNAVLESRERASQQKGIALERYAIADGEDVSGVPPGPIEIAENKAQGAPAYREPPGGAGIVAFGELIGETVADAVSRDVQEPGVGAPPPEPPATVDDGGDAEGDPDADRE